MYSPRQLAGQKEKINMKTTINTNNSNNTIIYSCIVTGASNTYMVTEEDEDRINGYLEAIGAAAKDLYKIVVGNEPIGDELSKNISDIREKQSPLCKLRTGTKSKENPLQKLIK